MIYAFLADGFEDVEALGVIDVCRRAALEVKTVSIMPTEVVESAHGVKIIADSLFDDNEYSDASMLFLPGGMPGASNLDAHEGLRKVILAHNEAGKPLAAICAAPLVYGRLGLHATPASRNFLQVQNTRHPLSKLTRTCLRAKDLLQPLH